MTDVELRALRDSMQLSSDTGKGIPHKGSYDFHHYVMEIKQRLNMAAEWGALEPLSPSGMIGFSRKYLPHLRVVNMKLMREQNASDASVKAIWARLPPLKWPEVTTDWGEMLSWLDYEDVVKLASDPRCVISFDIMSGSSASAAEKAASIPSYQEDTGKRAEEKRKLLLQEMTAVISQLTGWQKSLVAKPTDVGAVKGLGETTTRLEELRAKLAGLESKSATESAYGEPTPVKLTSIHVEKVRLSMPKASAGWQSILAILIAGDDLRKHVRNVQVKMLMPGGIGINNQLAPLGRVLSSLRWTKCPTPLLNLGAPWPGHFIEEVQRIVVPMSIQQMALMRTELEGTRKVLTQPFDEFAVELANKFAKYTGATQSIVPEEQRVNLLMAAVREGDPCCLMLHTQYSNMVAQACDRDLGTAWVSFDALVQRTSAALANMPKAYATPVTAAMAAVQCGFCGLKNHTTEQCFRKGNAVSGREGRGTAKPERKAATLSAAGGKQTKNNGSGRKKGVCFHCQQAGHFQAECPQLKSGGGDAKTGTSGKFQGTCHRCQRKGHRAAECRAAKPISADKASAASAHVTPQRAAVSDSGEDDAPVDPVYVSNDATASSCCMMRVTPLITRASDKTHSEAAATKPAGCGRAVGCEGSGSPRGTLSPAVDRSRDQAANVAGVVGSKPIYIDSGADAHLWADSRHIRNLRQGAPIVVSGYDGKGARRLTVVGDVEVRAPIGKVRGVEQYHALSLTAYYCPTASISLLSVACIVKDDSRLAVTFDREGVRVMWSQDAHTMPVCLLRGVMVGHHYEIKTTGAGRADGPDASSVGARVTQVTAAAVRSGSLAEAAKKARQERRAKAKADAGKAQVPPSGGTQGAADTGAVAPAVSTQTASSGAPVGPPGGVTQGPPGGATQGAVASGSTVPVTAVPRAQGSTVPLPQQQAQATRSLSYAQAVGSVKPAPKVPTAAATKQQAGKAKTHQKRQLPSAVSQPVARGQSRAQPTAATVAAGTTASATAVAAGAAASGAGVASVTQRSSVIPKAPKKPRDPRAAGRAPVVPPVVVQPPVAPTETQPTTVVLNIQGGPGSELQRLLGAVAAQQQSAGTTTAAGTVPAAPVGAGRSLFQAPPRPAQARARRRRSRRERRGTQPSFNVNVGGLPRGFTRPSMAGGFAGAASSAAGGTQTTSVPETLSSGQRTVHGEPLLLQRQHSRRYISGRVRRPPVLDVKR